MSDANLVILRASRLEALVPELMHLLEQSRPDDPLTPQTVVAAHPGMKQWLVGAMARKAGTAGIVANLDVVLPSAWLDRAARACLGDGAVSLAGWQRGALRWRIHACLQAPQQVDGLEDGRIARYLETANAAGEADLARRRFQLADRLAGVFSQYLVYRPDWLRAWERGQFRYATGKTDDKDTIRLERDLLGPLWRQLARGIGRHRAETIDALVAHLADGAGELEPVHAFGLSHLAPSEWEVLRAWSRHAPVHLYVPDPCREYWGGLRIAPEKTPAPLRDWQREEDARIADAGGGDWLDAAQEHPLLARWGRLGQHFYARLAEAEALADIRHGKDDAPDAPENLLQHVQESIRQLRPALLREARPDCADASLRVHACHTRLRELDVLRDALLDAVGSGIAPGDIVVMAPDIGAYAPLLPAVFGEPGDARERHLPWHLADAPVMRGHRLFATFARLLELGGSRIATTEVLDLLAVPEIARALLLDAGDVDVLGGWLRQSRAAWALDAAHRRDFGVPPAQAHTLAWGVDRMIAGYLMSDAATQDNAAAVSLPDGEVLLPLAGVQGPAGAALGALDRLLCELQAWRDLANATRKASDWAGVLRTRLDALLRIDGDDADAASAWSAIAQRVARIGAEPGQAGEDPELHFAVVRDLLLDALASVSERQRFLMGGITFCGMVPQRAIPFDMACVLGLNDGEFPRQRRDGGIDLMTRLRRIGDRDVRSDDRWLFLETVMSARKRLHFSYIGQGVRDGKPRNPAAPLAELMAELHRAENPWRVEHPLQPFDARYFDGVDKALYSHSQAFAAMRGDGGKPPAPFLHGVATGPDPLPDPVPLAALARFWKRPAEDLLGRRLQLDFSALGGGEPLDSEPLEPTLARIETVARRVFFEDALPLGFKDGAPCWSRDAMPAWVEHSGLLPPGELGRTAWEHEADAIDALLAAARQAGLPGGRGQALDVDLHLPLADAEGGRARLHGVVRQAFALPGEAGWLLLRAFPSAGKAPSLKAAKELDFGDRLQLFIEWAALRLRTAQGEAPPAVRVAVLANGTLPLADRIQAWDAHFLEHAEHRAAMLDALRGKLAALVERWWQAAMQPPMYFPKTSGAVLAAEDPVKAADGAFETKSDRRNGERDYAQETRVFARGLHFDAKQDVEVAAGTTRALLDYASELDALIALELPHD